MTTLMEVLTAVETPKCIKAFNEVPLEDWMKNKGKKVVQKMKKKKQVNNVLLDDEDFDDDDDEELSRHDGNDDEESLQIYGTAS